MSQTSPATPPNAGPTPPTPEGGVEADDIDSVSIAVWGTVSVFIVLVVILGAVALANEYQARLDQKRVVAPRYVAMDEEIITQSAKLASYEPPTPQRAGYQIPIDRAMEIVVNEWKAKQNSE